LSEEIELISLDGDPLLRWRFTEVGPDAFWWIGEYSTDESRTWRDRRTHALHPQTLNAPIDPTLPCGLAWIPSLDEGRF
jgi:hypothetical protein